jgi:hypothetical protein
VAHRIGKLAQVLDLSPIWVRWLLQRRAHLLLFAAEHRLEQFDGARGCRTRSG